MSNSNEVRICATVVIPLNALNLCCAVDSADDECPQVPYRGDSLPPQMHPYNLWELDPELLKSMVKAVKTATDNQISINPNDKNTDMQTITDAYNELTSEEIDVILKDIVRSIGVANYAVSYPATDSNYEGSDLHEFTHIRYDGLTEYMEGVTIYVKIVTPTGDDPIQVLSVHPNVDRKDEVAKSKIGNVLHKSKQILKKAGKLPK